MKLSKSQIHEEYNSPTRPRHPNVEVEGENIC
jgi:hypothetical protein